MVSATLSTPVAVVACVPHIKMSSASSTVWLLNTSVKSMRQLRSAGLSLPTYSLRWSTNELAAL